MREKHSNGPLREDETSKADCLNVNQLNGSFWKGCLREMSHILGDSMM